MSRSLVLARALEPLGVAVTFQTTPRTAGYDVLRASEFDVVTQPPAANGFAGLLIDVEHGPRRVELQAARAKFRRVIVVAGNGFTLDDYDSVREFADLEVYQGLDDMPGVKAVSGPAHILIDPLFARCRPCHDGHVVISFGGADPHQLTPVAVRALATLGRHVRAVIGPAARFAYDGELPGNVEVVQAPRGLARHLNHAALMVGAFGTVAWEAAAAGVPSVLSGWSENHIETAEELQRRGIARSVGLWRDVDGAGLLRAARAALRRPWWARASARAVELVDGQGAARVAQRVAECLQ